MPKITLSEHANRRLRQRGIPVTMIPLLMRFGAHEYDKNGAKLVYLNHKGKARLRRTVDQETLRRVESALDIYAVVASGDMVVTVGHRTQRINRN